MLTRSAAEGAATAAAAVVASAASVASEVARGLDGRRRAGRYTRHGNVLHQSHRTVSRFCQLLLKLANGTSAGRARACVLRRETATRAPPTVQACAASDAKEAAEATTAAAAAAAPSAAEPVSIAKPECRNRSTSNASAFIFFKRRMARLRP